MFGTLYVQKIISTKLRRLAPVNRARVPPKAIKTQFNPFYYIGVDSMSLQDDITLLEAFQKLTVFKEDLFVSAYLVYLLTNSYVSVVDTIPIIPSFCVKVVLMSFSNRITSGPTISTMTFATFSL